MRRLRKVALAVAGGLLAAVCAACGGSSPSGGANATLTISNESGSLWTCDFNPYNGSVNGLSRSASSTRPWSTSTP